MSIILTYKDDNDVIEITNVIAIINYRNIQKRYIMVKEDNNWYVKLNLPEGQYRYKYLINNEIYLIDTYSTRYSIAEDKNLWSTLLVDAVGKRYYFENKNRVNISGVSLMNIINEERNLNNKRLFNINVDKKIVLRIECDFIEGINDIIVCWYDPNRNLFWYSSELIYQDEKKDMMYYWFWLDLQKDYPVGNWCISIFIDGRNVIIVPFILCKISTYRKDGNLNYINNTAHCLMC